MLWHNISFILQNNTNLSNWIYNEFHRKNTKESNFNIKQKEKFGAQKKEDTEELWYIMENNDIAKHTATANRDAEEILDPPPWNDGGQTKKEGNLVAVQFSNLVSKYNWKVLKSSAMWPNKCDSNSRLCLICY